MRTKAVMMLATMLFSPPRVMPLGFPRIVAVGYSVNLLCERDRVRRSAQPIQPSLASPLPSARGSGTASLSQPSCVSGLALFP